MENEDAYIVSMEKVSQHQCRKANVTCRQFAVEDNQPVLVRSESFVVLGSHIYCETSFGYPWSPIPRGSMATPL